MNKKGQIIQVADNFVDILAAFILVIIVGATSLLLYANLSGLSIFSSSKVQGALDVLNNYATYFDWLFLILLLGAIIGSIMYLLSREVNLIQYLMSWAVVIIFSFFALIFGYTLQLLAEQTFFTNILNQMLFMNFFVNNSFIFSVLYFFFALLFLHIPKT